MLTRGMTLLRETVRVFSALAKKSSFWLETEQPLPVPLTRSNKRKAQQAATASGDRMSESLCSRDSKVIIFPKTASRRISGIRGKYVWTLGFMNLNFHANLRRGGGGAVHYQVLRKQHTGFILQIELWFKLCWFCIPIYIWHSKNQIN